MMCGFMWILRVINDNYIYTWYIYIRVCVCDHIWSTCSLELLLVGGSMDPSKPTSTTRGMLPGRWLEQSGENGWFVVGCFDLMMVDDCWWVFSFHGCWWFVTVVDGCWWGFDGWCASRISSCSNQKIGRFPAARRGIPHYIDRVSAECIWKAQLVSGSWGEGMIWWVG